MRCSVTEAKSRLTELVRLAEAGEEILLTRHGKVAIRLVPVRRQLDADARRTVIARIQASAKARGRPDVEAARSQDFLYGGDGMPK